MTTQRSHRRNQQGRRRSWLAPTCGLSFGSALARLYAFFLLAFVGLNVQADSVKVELTGLDAQLQENTLAFLSLAQIEDESPGRINRLYERAGVEIDQALQPFGYYAASTTATLTQPRAGKWLATFEIAKGQPVRLREVNIAVVGEGAELDALTRRLAKAKLEPGKRLRHERYEEEKDTLLGLLYDAGYLDARFTVAELLVDKDAFAADVRWEIDTGAQFFFGEVQIEQDILRPDLVSRYHSIQAGDPFDTSRLIDLQLALNNSNYFQAVNLDVHREDAVNQRIPVVVKTEPRKKRRYSLGLGFGTDTGPRTSGALENRLVNKHGHKYRVDAQVSVIESAVQFGYDIPIKDVSKDRWRLYAQAQTANVGDADTRDFAVGISREDSYRGWRRRLFFNVERSNFEFGDEPSQNATLVYPGVSFSLSRLDNPELIRRGYSFTAIAQAGAAAIGAETDFASLHLGGRTIWPLGKRGRFIGALDVAGLAVDDFSRLPPSQRFFLGGDRSVRGYGFQTISPENAAGDDIGGRYSVSANAEIDYRVKGPWGLAAFFDIGDVSNSARFDFSKGVGLGVRYRSPVGMIRFDLAHPLDDPDTAVRVHLSIGSDL